MTLALLLASLLLGSGGARAAGWELHLAAGSDDRPAATEGIVHLELDSTSDPTRVVPRYFNQIGVHGITLSFSAPASTTHRFSVIWNGGSRGPDRFAVRVDGISAGFSRIGDSDRYPYRWARDELLVRLGPGEEHRIEILPAAGFESEFEIAALRLAPADAPPYRPLGYESIGSLEAYQSSLGAPGVAIETDNLVVFAPREMGHEAKALSTILDRAHEEMARIVGTIPVFRFSVEHYPEGHERGWGGLSGQTTIGYPIESLQRFDRLRTRDLRGIAGYTEEMCHGFKAVYRCGGTSEALGVLLQEDVTRAVVPERVADAYWSERHRQWEETTRAYREAGGKNPDPVRYPENIFLYRILCQIFHRQRLERGPSFWANYFQALRQHDLPFHRAADEERLAIHADLVSAVLGRDARKDFEELGLDLRTGGIRDASTK